MGNPYDDYVSLLLIYVMYYTMKSVCVIAVILPKNQKTSSNMSEKNITFEDLPKAMSWLMIVNIIKVWQKLLIRMVMAGPARE